MSNIEMIIEERAADIGNFLVGRLLPFSQKRSVGHLYLSIIWDRLRSKIMRIWMFRHIHTSDFPL